MWKQVREERRGVPFQGGSKVGAEQQFVVRGNQEEEATKIDHHDLA